MRRQAKSAAKFVVCENSDPISNETRQIEDRIRQRAFEISQTSGHSEREMDDWLAAESEIISVPPAELIEKDETFVLQMAVGGIDPEELSVLTTADQILIKADFRHDHDPDAGTIHFCDFKSSTVFRSIHFPEPIESDTVKLQLQDGVLRITAQKETADGESQPKRASPAAGRPKRKAS